MEEDFIFGRLDGEIRQIENNKKRINMVVSDKSWKQIAFEWLRDMTACFRKNITNGAAPDKEQGEQGLKSFTFIWYKVSEIQTAKGTTKNYTTPYRTTIEAKSEGEAKLKLVDFAMSKTTVVIQTEEEFKKRGSDFDKMTEFADKLRKEMEEFMKRF